MARYSYYFVLLTMAGTAVNSVRAQNPDPMALLQGVEQSRAAIQSGKVSLLFQTTIHVPRMPVGDAVRVQIEFSGLRRTCVQEARVLVLSSKGPKAEADYARVMAMADYESAIQAGLGKWETRTVYSAWDGKDFFQYGAKLGASFRKHLAGTADYAFDPRQLGLLQSDAFTDTLENRLPHDSRSAPKYWGRETIAGCPCYHVSTRPNADIEYHYWIQPEKHFRVHRAEYRSTYRTDVVLSEYLDEGVLPRRVVSKSHSPDQKLLRESTVEVQSAVTNCAVDADVGSLRSIDIPPGEPLSDERIGQRLGYWDGKEIVDDYRKSIEIGQGREQARRAKRQWQWASVIGAGVILLVVVGFRLRRTYFGSRR